MRLPTIAASVAVSCAIATPLAAQDRSFNFALRGGVETAPAYPGASDLELGPALGVSFGRLTWGSFNVGSGIGNIPDNGISLSGAFNIVGSRKVSDNPELAGTQDIDTAVELGLGLTYRETNWQVFGEVRKGFGGHTGVVGTLGGDVIYRPTDRWTITAGPRLNFGDNEYATTYFNTPAGFGGSYPDAFTADGGLLGSGVEVGATYQFNNKWAFEGLLSYEKLRNSAADSPITRSGSDDQWTLRIGLSRAFTLRF